MPNNFVATASINTATPSKYINRLCKHFAHKVAVEYDDNGGIIHFDIGNGIIEKSNEGLRLQAEAGNQQDLTDVIDIMDRHFVRIAWQEELKLEWKSKG